MGNIQGLYPKSNKSKVSFLKELTLEEDPMFIALTETHLATNVKDSEIGITNYTLYRADREGRSHGGVMVYLRHDLAAHTMTLLSHSNGVIELLALHITNINLIIVNCYRPPQCNLESFSKALEKLNEVLETTPHAMTDVIICGDFNFPFICWPDGRSSGGTLEDQAQAKLLLEIADKLFLNQHIMEPTRRNNILDLFFTNNQESVSNCRSEKTIFSDHNIVYINTTYIKSKTPQDSMTPPNMTPFANFNFFSQKVDWDQLQQDLRKIDWKLALQGSDPNTTLNTLLRILLEVCTAYVPRKSNKKDRRYSIPRDRKILMRKRANLNLKLVNSTNETQRLIISSKIEDIEQKIKHSHEEQRRTEEHQAIENIRHNPKFFYSYCKKFLKTKSQIGPLVTEQGTITDAPKETCQMLAHQYNSVFSIPKTQMEILDPTTFFNQTTTNLNQLTDIRVTEQDIKKAIKELRSNSAAGPDGVPAILLLKCCEVLAVPIHMLWLASFDKGEIPALLKQAIISPIYKGGDRTLPKNYRPVALTSHIVKVIEKCVRDKLFTYLEVNNLIKENQHGFRKGRSCLSNLLAHYDWLLRNLSEGRNVDVVFLDFAKAFDKVDHGVLLHKARDLGISGKLGVWLYNFLTDRTQTVAVDGVKSTESKWLLSPTALSLRSEDAPGSVVWLSPFQRRHSFQVPKKSSSVPLGLSVRRSHVHEEERSRSLFPMGRSSPIGGSKAFRDGRLDVPL
ncbi:uncharacterized protein LOC143037360 [Oratosquilla oratoria]|uniref:uncharacterized protein LOC143037360 n=1 Tax=Oratosquilla oratoria TaxID=337810 RepID=UPI003F75E358